MMAADGGTNAPETRAAYYRNAASWAADAGASTRTALRVAWWVAGAAVIVALLEAVALAALAPLKTVVPYTILVDRETGYVQTVKGLEPGTISQDGAVTQSFLVQYVIARETFDAADLKDNYRKVLVWSEGPQRAEYQREMQRSNPSSPLNLYQPSTIVATTIKSVSLLSPTTALVRFDTTRQENGAPSGEVRSYAAVIAFRYSGAPLTMGDRFINPLGFQVTSYRRDAETVAGSAASTDVAAPVSRIDAAGAPAK
jgi:type IV secretion system protein VirB8